VEYLPIGYYENREKKMINIKHTVKEKFLKKEKITDSSEKNNLIFEKTGNWSIPDRMMGLWQHRKGLFGRRTILILIVLGLLLAFLSYSYFHVGNTYSSVSSSERNDISGTTYVEYGKNLLKFSPDGASCVNYSGDILWSTTFSMQSPIVDICESAVVVADQKGTQIYIFNETGLTGKFQTTLPIEKVKVAGQGVVSAVLEDGDTTWINFYDKDGNEIAKNRTTISESGYPLDIALSPDGLKLMVSYLCATEGELNTKVDFYSFDTVGQAEINNLVNSVAYKNEVVPKVIFIDDGISVAFRSNGFSIFKGKQIPEEKVKIEFEEEILSIFYDNSYLGFAYESDNPDHKYKIRIYDTNGKKILDKYIDYNYKEIKISSNQIILFNESEFVSYSINGHLKFAGNYHKPVIDVFKVNGLRKYFVLTQDSTDLIRLK